MIGTPNQPIKTKVFSKKVWLVYSYRFEAGFFLIPVLLYYCVIVLLYKGGLALNSILLNKQQHYDCWIQDGGEADISSSES
jgi:hypothetical protein